jgi:hypothetical protein
MGNNFFISYDLLLPGQNYLAVHDAVTSLGRWYKFQYSLYYVNTALSRSEAFRLVRAAMDWNDRLIVIDAHGATVDGVTQADIDAVNAVWFGTAASKAA